MHILVTGASGFIGKHLVPHLASQGHQVVPLARTDESIDKNLYESLVTSNIHGVDAIIHLAGIAHRTGTSNADYEKYNFKLTKVLANIANENGLKHFIFLSTAKVHGEESTIPFNSSSAFNPKDAYSESKANAETHLASLASDTIFSSIRPPVVYGKNAKANIATLERRIREGKPIPVPSRPNIRSFVSIENINAAVSSILKSNSNSYSAYLVDDRQPVSTEQFIMYLGESLGISPKLLKIPNTLFSAADSTLSYTIGLKKLSPLYRNFEIRCDSLEKNTNWRPVHDLPEGLKSMVG